ncbi:MAG: alpha/beta fold hydrolase [Propionibacteriaceae bacterium]|jgi:carboxylesterase|nr:alpha/beta fold hydrolase [Propionibacteriaceae bacterium]
MEIAEYARPIHTGSGDVGVLMCHGFTSTPHSLSEWAYAVAKAGYEVSVPRLPGHGTDWHELNVTSWQDWYDCVNQEFLTLRQNHAKVFVTGLSLGGALALRLAEQHPDDVAGLVLVNPAVLARWTSNFAPLLSLFIPALKGKIGSDIAMPGVVEYTYDVTPLKAVATMLKLWTDVRARLDLVTCPVVLYRSSVDHAVPKASAEMILRQISSEEVFERVLPRSWHVATMDYDKEEIFTGSIEFFASH